MFPPHPYQMLQQLFPGNGPFSPQPVDNQVLPPPAVRTAVHYLSQLDQKTQKKIAANDNQIEEFEGDELSKMEVIARDAACRLLASYFDQAADKVKEPDYPDCTHRSDELLRRVSVTCPCRTNVDHLKSGGVCPCCDGKGSFTVGVMG